MMRVLILLFIGVFFAGCVKCESPAYLTWSLSGESYPNVDDITSEDFLSVDDFPIGGTVSHHLLAGEYIDLWFSELASRRTVENFIILSPRHWDLGCFPVSLTHNSWDTSFGVVESNNRLVKQLQKILEVEPEPDVFNYEHGVSTLIPFIKKYFPGARIVAVAYGGEAPVDIPFVEKLYRSIDSINSKENFLLVSTDFSHHGNMEYTKISDNRSRIFLENPIRENWIFGGCDNRPGIYILSRFFGEESLNKLKILYHTDSYQISKMAPEDITSYFFTFVIGN